MYGRQTECAIAAMSRLAEVWDGGEMRLSATDIADSRGLQRPRVAKVLSVLSQAGLVVGSPGPGGGFRLADHPKNITLYAVFSLFEHDHDTSECPFGGGVCGVDEPCPLHDELSSVQGAMDHLLHETTFEKFRAAAQDRNSSKTRRSGKKKKTGSNRRR